MSKFTSDIEPLGRYDKSGKWFILSEPVVYDVGYKGSEETIVVPIGFVTDFASIPRTIQLLIPNYIGRRAAILHDYLYKTNGLNGKYSRQRADQIFLEALNVLEVNFFTRSLMYSGVRIGGWLPWRKHKQN